MEIVKSVYNSNFEVITNIMKLYNIQQFDLDCTYSKGNFWKNLPRPKICSDLNPIDETVIEANSENLPFDNDNMLSVMCDLPFLVSGSAYKLSKHNSTKISKRFECYHSFGELKSNYYNTLKELYRVTKKNGIVVFKCQDTVTGGINYLTHNMVINMGNEIGFHPKDLFILTANSRPNSFGDKWKKQHHARKYHSYFIVFEKIKQKVNYEFN